MHMIFDEKLRLLYYILILTLSIFYGYFFYRSFIKSIIRKVHKEFFKAVYNIVSIDQDINQSIIEINSTFRKIFEKNVYQRNNIKNPLYLLEELVFLIDTYDTKRFKKIYHFEPSSEFRKRITEYISQIRLETPYVSLPAKEANLMSTLHQSLETDNKELGLTTLNQLSNEIEFLSYNYNRQEMRNLVSHIVTIIGFILTIITVAMSIIPLILKISN